jgi:hypothetical protein
MGAVQVFPNPTRDYIFIVGNSTDKLNIILRDYLGKFLLQMTGDHETKISMEAFASGLYIVEVNGQRFRVSKLD